MPLLKSEIDSYLAKHDSFGMIAENDIALCFALKKHLRTNKMKEFNAFAFYHQDAPLIFKNICNLIQNNQYFSFQFAYKMSGKPNLPEGHWTFCSMQFNPVEMNLMVFICDPLGHTQSEELFSLMVDSGIDFYKLSELLPISIFYPNETLQFSQKGCSYFAIDGCFLLSNQNQFGDLYNHMENHRDASIEMDGNIKFITAELPLRLIRGQQSFGNTTLSKALDNPERCNQIINTKNVIFSDSVNHYTETRGKKINARVQMKKDTIQHHLSGYFKTISDHSDLQSKISAHRIEGFLRFVDNKLDSGGKGPRKRS